MHPDVQQPLVLAVMLGDQLSASCGLQRSALSVVRTEVEHTWRELFREIHGVQLQLVDIDKHTNLVPPTLYTHQFSAAPCCRNRRWGQSLRVIGGSAECQEDQSSEDQRSEDQRSEDQRSEGMRSARNRSPSSMIDLGLIWHYPPLNARARASDPL